MTCHSCRVDCVKAGKYGRKRVRRDLCKQWGKRYREPQDKPLGDVRLEDGKVRMILNCLVEGNSVRGTARLCDVEKRTALRILKLAGENCEELLRHRVRNVSVHDVELDEAWTFILKKERQKTGDERRRDDIGDQYVFVAIERTSKLVLCWHLGRRNNPSTWDFTTKLRDATAPGRLQLNSDAFSAYPGAIDAGLYDRADYGEIIKLYGKLDSGREAHWPLKIKGAISAKIQGMPNPRRICTSPIERNNGTLRQWCKRFARLTYAFSKKRENLRAALALHFAHYNFCRVHGSLRVTPAIGAGISDHVWDLAELKLDCTKSTDQVKKTPKCNIL
jgi:transposase-like protein